MYRSRFLTYLVLLTSCKGNTIELNSIERQFIDRYQYRDTLEFYSGNDSIYTIVTLRGKVECPGYNPISSDEKVRVIGEVNYNLLGNDISFSRRLIIMEKDSRGIFFSIRIKDVSFSHTFPDSITYKALAMYRYDDSTYRFVDKQGGEIYWRINNGIVKFQDRSKMTWIKRD